MADNHYHHHLFPNVIAIVLLLGIIIPLATSLNFSYVSFTPNDHQIMYNGSASAPDGFIQITLSQRGENMTWRAGRATYAQPLHLWDASSGRLADFSTDFSFRINSFEETQYADGLAFFLVPLGSSIDLDNRNAKGENLGLTSQPITSSVNDPFVAVEFDIYPNGFDPPYNLTTSQQQGEHVGIDINSLKSKVTWPWSCGNSIREGKKHQAWISYNSKSMNLTVSFTSVKPESPDRLVRNEFSYTVNLSKYLLEFVNFGFSAATAHLAVQHTITSWNFSSNLVTAPAKSNTKLVVCVAVGGIVLVTGLLICFWWKRKTDLMNEVANFDVSIGHDFERGSGAEHFAYKDLKQATKNFAQQGKLGEGGFGSVYKGFLKAIDSNIAVKRVSKGSKQGIREYASEVNIISRLRHRNLVRLLGWCREKKELLLVYEFMPNGSLDFHLFNGKSLLDWSIRLKIAQGLASALIYLHEEWEQYVVHRDIKPSNIMLDSSFNAKLGDFGLARMVDHEKECQTTALAGTWGYMAPEYVITCKASKETYVFSFGTVVLEIASGRKVTNPKLDDGENNLVGWAWNLYEKGKLLDAADPQLGGDFNSREMEKLLIVGLWCAHPYSTLRPSIKQVVPVLIHEAPLPILPSRSMLPSYPPPVNELSSTYDITLVSAR